VAEKDSSISRCVKRQNTQLRHIRGLLVPSMDVRDRSVDGKGQLQPFQKMQGNGENSISTEYAFTKWIALTIFESQLILYTSLSNST
jgi:hypothetical protein